ncbi:hypothetical protein MASR1M6_32980 [Rubrivivax sp.]
MKTTKRALPLAALGCAVVLTAASLAASTMAQAQAQAQTLRPVDVARGLDHPWSLAFLPDGRMLVTERAGRLRIVAAAGQVSPPVAGLPPVAASGQCGLLDVVLDPRFAENQRIYWSYAEAGEGGNSTAVARGRLQDGRVDEVQLLFRQQPKVASSQHCGGRLVFARDGRLFVTLGDRFSRKEDAQNLANHLGKIVRIEADGRVPADNPFAGRPGAAAEIWSLGHRNVQGAALHPDTGELWASEHGPQGGDEINLIEGGRNYGWPLLTFGRNYGTGHAHRRRGPQARLRAAAEDLGADLDRARAAWPSSPASATPAGRAASSSARCAARPCTG